MATLSTYIPAASRRIRKTLAISTATLASALALVGLAPDGASASHSTTGAPSWGCADANLQPVASTDPAVTLQTKDRAERSVRCLVNHWRTDSRAPGADRIRVPSTGQWVARTRPAQSTILAFGHRSTLRLAARRHSQQMANQDHFYHCSYPYRQNSNCPAGYGPADRLRAAGYCGSWRAENIRWGGGTLSTPLAAVEGWRDPEFRNHTYSAGIGNGNGHWANILSTSANEQGVGVALAAPTTYTGQAATYTQDLGAAAPC